MDIENWKKTRARPGQVTYQKFNKTNSFPEKNSGLYDQGLIENDHIHCKCTICNHKYQAECEEAAFKSGGRACFCCSSMCT